MGLFLSTAINKIDKKGRVSVPATFRSTLANETFKGVILFKSYKHQAIEGVGMSTMQEYSNRMDDNLALFSDEHDELATVLFGDSHPLAFDGDGRITMPQDFLDFAGITDQAAFVGLGKKFQIWAPEALDNHKKQAREASQSKRITLPKHGGDTE